MPSPDTPPTTIGAAIDEIERIREQLFVLQRQLEKIERVEAAGPSGENPKG
jgi:hypothetical protein